MKIIEEGKCRASKEELFVLYYNMGNAYYDHGEYENANIAFIEAQKLNMKDSDLKDNLELVKEKMKEKWKAEEENK